MTCPHRHIVDVDVNGLIGSSLPMHHRRCWDCNEAVGCGEASTPLNVCLEIAAAEWALEFDRPNQTGPCIWEEECGICQARHLASVIRNHDEMAKQEVG